MGAGTTVRIPARQEITEHAATGVRHAHRAMHEGLDVHLLWNMTADLPNFIEAQLPGTDHALCAELPPEKKGLPVRIVRLRGNMELNGAWEHLLCNHEHAWIRDENRIDPRLGEFLKIRSYPLKVIVVGEDVRRHENLDLMCMGVGYAFPDLLQCKVFCIGPKSEGLSAEVNGIGPVVHGGLQYLQRTRWNQKLCFFQHMLSPLFFHTD